MHNISVWSILLTVVGYFALLLVVSRLTSRRQDNDAFFRGNRQSPWYMVAFGMIGASISGVTFVSVPGMVMVSDMNYMQTCLGFVLGYFVVAFVLLPVYYRCNLTTIYSFLHQRLGLRSYRTGASFFILSKMTGAAARFYVVCYVLQTFVLDLFGVPFPLTVLIMVALIWLYTRRSGIRTLVDYAVQLGHRRIAYIHGQRNSSVTETRITSFYRAMEAHSLSLPQGYLVEGRYDDIARVEHLTLELLQRPDRPTCVLLPDDSSYFGAMAAAQQSGLRVPEDVSFAGYDGISITQSIHPRLTTVRQDSEGMGREAAMRLIDRVEHPNTAAREPVCIPIQLIAGETMAAPKQ